MSTYRKPSDIKYWEMCKYIDENMQYLANEGEYPEIEQNIYEYLYNVAYALAYVGGYFKKMSDYDNFSLYCAGELYIKIRNRYQHLGEFIRGKEQIPIKSSLNYIKSVLYPFKIDYQRTEFNQILNPKTGIDTDKIADDIKSSIQQQYCKPHYEYYEDAIKCLPDIINEVINETPFKWDSLMCKKLRFSILLTLLNQLTITNKTYRKIEKMNTKIDDGKAISNKTLRTINNQVYDEYVYNPDDALLWHLDKRFGNYIKVLVNKVKKGFSNTMQEYIDDDQISDEMLTIIMNTAYDNFKDVVEEEGE